MSLTRWEPFGDLMSLREAMDRLFEESFVRPRRTWLASLGAEDLAVDMYESAYANPCEGSQPSQGFARVTNGRGLR